MPTPAFREYAPNAGCSYETRGSAQLVQRRLPVRVPQPIGERHLPALNDLQGQHCVISCSLGDIPAPEDIGPYSKGPNRLLGQIMVRVYRMVTRWQTRVLLLCVLCLTAYILLMDPSVNGKVPDDAIDIEVLEEELEVGQPIRVVTYKSPVNPDLLNAKAKSNKGRERARENDDDVIEPELARTMHYNRIWSWANKAIGATELFPDTPEINDVFDALANARIVNVDTLYIGDYESGTSEKWVVTLEGGQKAMMKLLWDNKGTMKTGGLCNYGFEIPTAEIAAFHLHSILGFRNTPYVTGRSVDLRREVFPVASPSVAKQIHLKPGNETCVTAKCYFCKSVTTLCPPEGVVEVSMAYWIPRKLRLHTFPPVYLPYSTPSMDEWKQYGFNNRTYCDKIRAIKPYDVDKYYYDTFDFAVLDTLMYHFDTKHYTMNDKSEAHGMTVRLDHGRAFCAYDRDDEQIFLAPITQCCTLRKSTWEKLNTIRGGALSRKLRQAMSRDPIAPILSDVWYPVLERRLQLILETLSRCAHANGGWDAVLVDG